MRIFPKCTIPAAALIHLALGVLTRNAYAQGGVPLWTNYYSSGPNYMETATRVAVDANGNVFVTGNSVPGGGGGEGGVTVAYSAAGVPLWTNLYAGCCSSPCAIAVDASGNVFVAGSALGSFNYDFTTVAYSGAGVALWTNRYNGGHGSDNALAAAVDLAGNVFVTGQSANSFGYDDYVTVACSGAGLPLWTNRYNPMFFSGYAYARAVAVDTNGNVFVTGQSQGDVSGYDYATIAYSGAGVPLWTNRYNGPANGGDWAVAVAVDGQGRVFVTGNSWNGASVDYETVAYSSGGLELWERRYHGPGSGQDQARTMAMDRNGNVFVTGSSSAADGSSDYATVAYSGDGVPLWTNRYRGPQDSTVYAEAVATDRNGDVFVTGQASGTNGFRNYATIAYSGSGQPLWTNTYNGGNSYDDARALAVDNAGNVFVTGQSAAHYCTIKYSSLVAPAPVTITIQRSGTQLQLIWSAGILQSADDPTGLFADLVGATSPYSLTPSEARKFFRVRQ
jgi:hypothetical protein